MPELILTDDQMKELSGEPGPVAVRDRSGNVVGRFEPRLTPERIAELKREAGAAGPWYTGEQVQARFSALEEEWERTGGFDEAHLESIMERLDATDPGHSRRAGGAG